MAAMSQTPAPPLSEGGGDQPKRQRTPSFVAEFPLAVTRAQEHVLVNRFKAAAHLYNGVLGEALSRAKRMRSDPDWAKARILPKLTKDERKARSAAFSAVAARQGFRAYDLQKHAEDMRDHSWLRHHLGSHDTQTTSLRAFRAVADWVYKGRGRPRFKRGEQFSSVESKSNDAVIRYRHGIVYWQGLELPLLLDARDKRDWEGQALIYPTKYVRLVRRKVRGRMRYYAQLVQQGSPPRTDDPVAKDGVGCLDFGPATVAAVVPGKLAALLPLAPKVKVPARKIRVTQRAMDRSRRATNPDNFNSDGTARRGARKWIRSPRYLALQDQKADLERCLTAERKRAHGELARQLLSYAPVWTAEKLSYRSFQVNFGRSVARCAPSLLLSTLSRQAASAGGKVVEFPTRPTRLSQFDHTTGDCVKKPLSQRTHFFRDGRTAPVQRDVYSAFLGSCVRDNLLDTAMVSQLWPGAEPLLQQPVSELPPIRERRGLLANATPPGVRVDRLSTTLPARAATKMGHAPSSAAGHPVPSAPTPAENTTPLPNGHQGGSP